MEIYKDLSNPASKEFEKLLNSQLSKINIEEGKIIEGKINKITEKFVFLFVEGLKSEPVLDINELKSMGLSEKIKIGEKIISGEYYFFVNNSMGFQTSNNNLGSGVPDPYGSGKVDEETYNSLSIGDKYCF